MRPLPMVPRAILVLTAMACSSASTTTSGTARPATQTIRTGGASNITIAPSMSSDVSHLTYAADAVWRILPSIFDSIAVPLTTVIPSARQIGNLNFKIRSRLGKAPLSRYLDCGNTQIGPNADSYDVLLSVLTTVAAEGTTGSTLTTVVEAQAKPITYNQGYSRCTSKGSLEQRIADLVKARLAP